MSTHTIVPLRVYFSVFGALLLLTALTVAVAFFDLGVWNNLVAMGIAVFKATLVVLYFMHVRHSTPLTKIIVVGAFLWFVLLVVYVIADVRTREMLQLPSRPPTF